MAQHPLASLRGSVGLSHPAYARLVAQTHADLGFGHMAARREKVSRWESGRTAPELTAQLAMAHIHQVPGEEVERLGWPHWLHLATDDATLLHQPWTPDGAINGLHTTTRPAGTCPRPDLTLTGPALVSLTRKSLSTLTEPHEPPARTGYRVTPDTVTWIETRTQALEAHEAGTFFTPTALYLAARTEHQLVTNLLTSGGYDRDTGIRLLLLAARTATLCAWLSSALGEEARAERYTVAAIRAAGAAGARQHVAAYLSQLAIRHIIIGDPDDALSLVHAAQTATRHPTARFAASLHTKEALALARLGEVADSALALGRAADALAANADSTDRSPASEPFDIDVDEGYLAIARGNAWLFLDRPHKALPCFATLLDDGPPAPTPDRASPYTARRLLYAVDVQLALNELDAAAHSVHRAVTLTGTPPPGLTRQFRQRLTPHRTEPLIRDVLDLLAEATT